MFEKISLKLVKKPLAFLLALVLIAGLMPVTAFGDEGGGSGSSGVSGTASVRIEANGFGTYGTTGGKGTVLDYTTVDLSTLNSGFKAIDVVNKALGEKSLGRAQGITNNFGTLYTTFGGISGANGESWVFFLNDNLASAGLGGQAIGDKDRIVLMLTGYDNNWNQSTDYSYFKYSRAVPSLSWGHPCAEVTFQLLKKKHLGWDTVANANKWQVDPVAGASISVNGGPAYTPGGSPAVTDSDGFVTIQVVKYMATAGIHPFDITADIEGSTKALCRVSMDYDGTNAPTVSVDGEDFADTSLKSLTLKLTDEGSNFGLINGLPYGGGRGLKVTPSVSTVSLGAVTNDNSASIESVSYQSETDVLPGAFNITDSNATATLKDGRNTFKVTVKNGEARRTYTLVILKEAASQNIPSDVASLIDGLRTELGYQL